jgi:hypothetical protein
MTDKQTPPDWVLLEAAKRSNWLPGKTLAQMRGHLAISGAFSALCDMIERYEQPPPDRKLLCAEQAMYELQTRAAHRIDGSPVTTAKDVAVRAIELYEEGFGK